MRRLVVTLSLAATVAACGEGPAAVPTRPAVTPSIERMEIEGQLTFSAPGETSQLRAIAVMSDGTRQDVTRDAHWTVIDERVGRVAPGGLLTVLAYGDTQIYTDYRNVFAKFGYFIRVLPPDKPVFDVGVVVRDEQGHPVQGARLHVRAHNFERLVRTDDNGFVDLGPLAGPVDLIASRLGYADAVAILPEVTAVAQVPMVVVSNPGSYIERTVEDPFDVGEDGTLYAHRTYRIVTRAGGLFDVETTSEQCDYNGTLQITVRSGTSTFVSPEDGCYARLRFVVPSDELQLTVRGYKTGAFRLTYREPR